MDSIGLTAVLTPDPRRLDRKGNPAELRKLRHSDSDSELSQPLHKRQCKRFSSCSDLSRLFGEGTDNTAFTRDRVGCKGLYLKQMKDACLPVPRFEFIDTRILKAIEKHPIDLRPLKGYVPDDMPSIEETFYGSMDSLVEIKARINQLSPADKVNRDQWLDSLSAFIASDAFYRQVKDSFAAREIRACHQKLNSPFKPVIVRGSGVAEDHFADVRTGKYQSIVHGEADIVRTCLKVMASSYCSMGCPQGVPQPLAIILQECINCRFGGVAMSSLQDKTIRVEYVPGQPKGALTGQSDMKPHNYIIKRDEGQIPSAAFTHGNIPAAFVLEKVDGGSGFMEVKKVADDSSVHGYDELGDDILKHLRRSIEQLENLLRSPVQVEFGIDQQGRLFLLQVVIPPLGILDMPAEIITKVISMLPMKDIKNFKVTCKHINEIVNGNYLVEKCWFNKFPGIIQNDISEVFNRENYEGSLRSWVQRFDNNLSAESFDKIKQYNNFPVSLSFGVAQTLTEAPKLKLVEKAALKHSGLVNAVIFSPDGRHLVTASDDQKVKLFSRNSQGKWRVGSLNNAGPGSFSPDSRHVLITAGQGIIVISGLNSQGVWGMKGLIEHRIDGTLIFTAFFSPDSRHLVMVFNDDKVELYSLKSHEIWEKDAIFENDAGASVVTFSTDSRSLVVVSGGGQAKLYSLNSHKTWTKNDIVEHEIGVNGVDFSNNSRHLVISCSGGKAKLYSLNSLNSLNVWTRNTIIERDDEVKMISFSLDDCHVMTCSRDDVARLYSLDSLEVWIENAIIEHDAPIDGVYFSWDSRHVMASTTGFDLILYSLDGQGMWKKNIIFNAQPPRRIDEDICLVQFSPDSRHVMVCYDEGDVALFSLNSQGRWGVNALFSKIYPCVTTVRFSPDSRHAEIGYYDDFSDDDEEDEDDDEDDYDRPKQLFSLNHHDVWVEKDTIRDSCSECYRQVCKPFRSQATHFGLDGSPLVFTFHDGVSKLITLNSQGELAEKATIEGNDWVESATFSPEGRHLVTSTRDNRVHVFEILPLYPEDPPNSEQLTVP